MACTLCEGHGGAPVGVVSHVVEYGAVNPYEPQPHARIRTIALHVSEHSAVLGVGTQHAAGQSYRAPPVTIP